MRVTVLSWMRVGSMVRVAAAGLTAIVLSGWPAVAQAPTDQTATDAANATRRAAEDLARDANRAFDRYLEGKPVADTATAPASRTAEAGTPPPQMPSESGSDWLQRIQRSYGELIQRLSEPTVPNPVQDAARRQALERVGLLERPTGPKASDGASGVVVLAPGSDAGAVASSTEPGPGPVKPWLEREIDRRSAEVRNEVMDKLAERGAAPTAGRTDGALPPATPSSEGWMAWLNRGYDEFQRDVVSRLATPVDPRAPAGDAQAVAQSGLPEAGSEPSSPRLDAPPKVLPPLGAVDGGADAPSRATTGSDADNAKAAVPDMAAAAGRDAESKAKEAAEARIVEQQRADAERRAVEAARRAEVARRAEAARKAAERKAADEARLAEARAAEARETAEAARKAAERKAVDEARLAEARAAEARETAEAARKAAERKAVDEVRVAEARAADVVRKAELARREADRKFAAQSQAAAAARVEADKHAEARRATVLAAAEAARQAAQAAEQAEIEAHRLSEAGKLAQQRVLALRASPSPALSPKPRLDGEVSGLGRPPAKTARAGQTLADAVRASALAREAAEVARRTQRIVRREADRARLAAAAADSARQAVEAAPNAGAGRAAAKKMAALARQAMAAAAQASAARLPRDRRAQGARDKADRLKAELGANALARPAGAAVVAPLPVRRPAASGRSTRGRGQHGACFGAGRTIKVPGWCVVAQADTLSQISARHYHSPQAYRRIAKSNARRIAGADVIRPCQRLYLPK